MQRPVTAVRAAAAALVFAGAVFGQPAGAGCPAVSAHVYRIALYRAPGDKLVEFGAGFFATQDGVFITARHIFEQAGRGARAVVEIGDEKRPVESVLAESRKLDIMVLRVNPGSARVNVPPAAEKSRVGDEVVGFRIAWPPVPGIKCTAGRISAISPRAIAIRGDAFFVPGSSGSPVFNSAGQVVAVALEMVNTKRTGKPDWIYTGLPVRQALSLARQR